MPEVFPSSRLMVRLWDRRWSPSAGHPAVRQSFQPTDKVPGYQSGSCGYCKAPASNSTTLTIEHYQILMDRGWRRSERPCHQCFLWQLLTRTLGLVVAHSSPLLVLSTNLMLKDRVPTNHFKPSRDQRQTLHRWNRFVLGDGYAASYARLHPKTKVEKKAEHNSFDLSSTVHASETNTLPPEPKPEHNYTVKLDNDTYTDEKYTLFEKYQRIVHKEPPSAISKSGFRRFLCASPLINDTAAETALHPRISLESDKVLGSFHQLHRLNNKLIAISVLDLLPHAVSAVYFIYDPELEKHGLGKLSALREAAMAEERGYMYYYMGYYIHDCAKMRYKADYRPQEVLDMSDGADNMRWRTLDKDVEAQMSARTFGVPDDQPSRPDLSKPIAAANSGLSLLKLQVPGVLPSSALLAPSFDLGKVFALIGKKGAHNIVNFDMLTVWDDDSAEEGEAEENKEEDIDGGGRHRAVDIRASALENSHSIKGVVAELAAAVGLEVARAMIVSFGSSS
ncbi:hypothetical protein FH972_025720 [Carpinus fangiana]|uniref:Arginyl-tRNA--protein transferase n=1 Tax=Carpinus fangiana TaxID=176857 RepID=A0A5N6L276_9ROSI|nr:hypothetical protein FH972_025720 [Carpinus fangiana]